MSGPSEKDRQFDAYLRGDSPLSRAYKEDARDYERVNEWIDRIGWKRFFEVTELPFTKYHIDNWRGARNSLNASAHIHF